MWRIKLVDDPSSEGMGIRSQQAAIMGGYKELQLESGAAAHTLCLGRKFLHQSCPFLLERRNGNVTPKRTSDITATLLKEICHDVRTESPLIEFNGEVLNERTANTRPETRLDVSVLGF